MIGLRVADYAVGKARLEMVEEIDWDCGGDCDLGYRKRAVWEPPTRTATAAYSLQIQVGDGD